MIYLWWNFIESMLNEETTMKCLNEFSTNIKPTMRCWLGYYEFRLLMNDSMSITKDLLLYFIECNCDEWLYEYYEESIVVLYWTLIVMNGWITNTKGVLLLYWMLNCYGMFVCVLQRIYYCVYWMLNYYEMLVQVSRRVYYYVTVNVKLLWIVWMSNSRDITIL
jgi:hypothetical protein